MIHLSGTPGAWPGGPAPRYVTLSVRGIRGISGSNWGREGWLAGAAGASLLIAACSGGGGQPSGSAARPDARSAPPALSVSGGSSGGYEQTSGVGTPVILYFSHPIRNRAAVERSLQLRTSRPVTGAWY